MSRKSFSPNQDPYNVQDDYIQQQSLQQQQQTQTQRFYLDDIDQIAYDSMSTILEVDSEGTNSEASDRLRHFDSPLHLATARTPEPKTATLESPATSHTTNDRLSPVSDLSPKDKFSGIISALAEQMERLQPSKPATAQQSDSKSNKQISRPKYGALKEDDDDDDDDATRPPSVDSSNSSSRGSKGSSKQHQQDASTSPLNSENSSRTNSPSPPRLLDSEATTTTTNVQRQRAGKASSSLEPKSRATSAESLMMIAVSPMVSPRVKFPIIKHAKQADSQFYEDGNSDERKIVEVSNKSTITAIDLALMDKMVQKYFVETKEKATQSIKFDCDDEFDTLEFNNTDGSLRRRTGAGNGLRAQVKSVAVGTEKFSRERFSLLPQTKTRSTQTKSNVDNDIGASETRRYKLAHLDLGTLRRSQTKDAGAEAGADFKIEDEPQKSTQNSVTDSPEEDQAMQKIKPKARASSSPLESKTTTEEGPVMNEKPTPHSSQDPHVDSSKLKVGEILQKKQQSTDSPLPTKNRSLKSSSPSNSESSDQNIQDTSGNNSSYSSDSQAVPTSSKEKEDLQRQIDVVPEKQKLDKVEKLDKTIKIPEGSVELERSAQSRALIPSVKTELRVIIEIQDFKQKQRSEILSESQFIDGKLSKKTQVNTSKHVAATPREVLNRLQAVGRESSLVYQNPKNILAAERTPEPVAVAAGYQSPLRRPSPPHTVQNGSNSTTRRRENEAYDKRNWREVSKSTVTNEIETKTRKDPDNRLGSNLKSEDSDIIMTSDALINHMANDKSAIELRSRAAQRYESHETDPRTGKQMKTGKIIERTLVESEAGFNDNHFEKTNEAQDERANNIRNKDKERIAVDGASSDIRTPVPRSNLLDNVADQQRRIKSESVSSSRQRTPILSPRRQQSTMNEQQVRQRHDRLASQSAPNVQAIPQIEKQLPIPKLFTPIKRQASIEIEEETEDRQQVMENGRLVYDDRLRERKYETQKTPSPSLNVPSRDNNLSPPDMRSREYSQQLAGSRNISPRSPTLSPTVGILRNKGEINGYQQQSKHQRAQLLKPFSLHPNACNSIDSPQAPILFADQTSNLSASSDPETMDSGFAQSGAGSNSVLNQQRIAGPSAISPQYHPVTVLPSIRRSGEPSVSFNSTEISRQIIEREQRSTMDQIRPSRNFRPHQEQLEEPISLNFVDDDVDELIDQLDTSPTTRRIRTTPESHRQQIRQSSNIRLKKAQRVEEGK